MALPGTNYLSSPFDDPLVDQIEGMTGVIDSVPSLSFDISDEVIVKNLDARIEDSKTYYDNPKGFDLTHYRSQAQLMYLGKQADTTRLYRFQQPYIENQIYVAVESIVAYLTAQNPAPEVYPSDDTPQAKKFAQDIEKASMAHSEHFQLAGLLESVVRNTLTKKVGFIYFHFDPDYGKNGEIIPIVVDPQHVVVDKNAKKGCSPGFISISLKMSVNEILHRWPHKKTEIYEELGIVDDTAEQMEQELTIREVWITHYDKKNQPQEGCIYYFGNCVLDKVKDPNWLHVSPEKNFLPAPMKPFIPLNFDNDGSHWIDYTSPIEQAMPLQTNLNKRGRQMMELADKANGLLIVSSDSGLTTDDLQDLTGDPNQKLVIKTAGQHTSDMVFQVPPPVVIPFLMQDKQDQRAQIHAIMGTPSEFTGSDDGTENGDETLGKSVMKKNQASGRQDLFARSIDRFMTKYFNFWIQMAVVWYDDKHWFTYNGGDGEFDYIEISRETIDPDMAVSCKGGSNLSFDKSRQEAVGLQLAKMDKISPLDLYKMLHIPNPQQVYDNWVKYTTAPQELARDALNDVDSSKAYIAFTEIMHGKKAEDPDDCTEEFVLSLRKLMIRDEFMKAEKKNQKAFLDYVEKAINSLELRMALDEMSGGGVQNLEPSVPLPPPPPPMPPMPGMMGGMPGMPMMPSAAPGMPPALPPQSVGSLPGATPGMMPPLGPPPMPMPPMNGTPIMNPAAPQMPSPGNVSAIPSM